MSDSVSDLAVTYELDRWDLTDLLPDPSPTTLDARLTELEADVRALEGRRGELAPDLPVSVLRDLLRRSERIAERAAVLGAYASLWFAADTQSPAALAFRNRVQQALVGLENRLLFFSLWWKELEDEPAQRLLEGLADSPDDVHHLRDQRRLRPYTLDERSEQLVNLKDADGIGAVLTVYSIVTNRLEFTLEVDGTRRTLTRDALQAYVHSPRAELREAAYRELYRVYGGEQLLLGQLYTHRVRDWHNENVAVRGFASPIAVRNVANDVPDQAVEALLEETRAQAPLFQRYFRLKARWLGFDRLRRYDLYAPVAASDREIPYGQAVASVLETFGGFDPRFAALAERVFAQRHVDSEVRRGKKGGAFCATVLPRLTPWMLVNYTGKVRDVATLAHELGHAVHSMMAEHHSIFTQHASLPLAETASVFGEMLMTDRLLREERDPAARRELLVAHVDDMYATVMRQAFFVRFELAAHRAVMEGASTDELADLYRANLGEQFGDAVEVAEEFRWEWLSIPHIYSTPFYCYAYSFGQLLVLALYRRYLEEGDAFKPGYFRMLAHGGSAPPTDILAEADIDPADRSFWRGGFEVIRERIEELEGLEPPGPA